VLLTAVADCIPDAHAIVESVSRHILNAARHRTSGYRTRALRPQEAILAHRADRPCGDRDCCGGADLASSRGHGSCRGCRPPRGRREITVTTATAKTGDVNVYLQAIGTVTPVYTNSITSQVNGLVAAVRAIHLNFISGSYQPSLTEVDRPLSPRQSRSGLLLGLDGSNEKVVTAISRQQSLKPWRTR